MVDTGDNEEEFDDDGLQKRIYEAQAELLRKLAACASEEEEKFFEEMRDPLDEVCRSIAEAAKAESAAIFFVAEDWNPPEMVMRGASGRLRETLNNHEEWRKAKESSQGGEEAKAEDADTATDDEKMRSSKEGEKDQEEPPNGVCYPTKVDHEWRTNPGERRHLVKGWSVTNQIWHLARGRIANSNRDMDDLQGGSSRLGAGDDVAYPNTNLATTFRSMVGVPIFVRGGRTEHSEIEPGATPGDQTAGSKSESLRDEFLGRYRVVGILKVEGKLPQEKPSIAKPETAKDENGEKIESEEGEAKSESEDKKWESWREKILSQITENEPFPAKEFPKIEMTDDESEKDQREKGRLKRIKATSDRITSDCHAKFTHNDIELLVLFAMQLGRILVQRVIKHASDPKYNIVLSENDVGVLNIRWSDVEPLHLLRTAAEAALTKVESHIAELKMDLDYEEHSRIHAEQVSEFLQPRGPIRDFKARIKQMRSLLPKLVQKQIAAEQNPESAELGVVGFRMNLENQSHLAERRTSVRGWARLEIEPLELGRTPIEVDAQLGVEGGPRAYTKQKKFDAALKEMHHEIDLDHPLVQRIVDPDAYGIDDLAGVRIITDYVTDLDKVRGKIIGRQHQWKIRVRKIDDALREGKDAGYRGVHITVEVDIDDRLPDKDVEKLKQFLRGTRRPGDTDEPLKIPVEIQLRTAYEHSWSEKAHSLAYKREDQIAPALRESLKILSNLLYQADELSDIVRSSIIRMLLPDDFGEMKLLEYLKPRLSRQGFVQLQLGLVCSKAILKDKLRYSGGPRYSHAIEVCETLVQDFGVLDTDIFLLALLREIWDSGRSGDAGGQRFEEDENDPPRLLFKRRFQAKCDMIYLPYLRQLFAREPDSRLLDLWLDDFPAWFWEMQKSFRKFFQQKAEDPLQDRLERLDELRTNIIEYVKHGGHGKPENLLERAYVIEAAVLLAQLTDLPNQPSRGRRKQSFREYFGIYDKIRRLFPNTAMKSKVVEVLDKAFRKTAADLDLAIPMELDE